MKTIEEEASDYADKHGFRVPYNVSGREIKNDDYYDKTDVKASKEGFIKGVEFAQRWIPVEEELPEKNSLVLIKSRGGRIYLSYFNIFGEFSSRAIIKYWRPLEYK